VQIPVLVEPVADNGFRATAGEPLALSADGATPEEAVRNLRAAKDRQLKDGKQLRSVDIASENPWLAMAGMHDPNDPLVQEWKQEMAAYRQEVEDDPDRP
jgi:predicted RNase H-like HicB family nuclease